MNFQVVSESCMCMTHCQAHIAVSV